MDLIREDISSASRDGAISLKGPPVTPETSHAIHACAAAAGWRISIDLFTTRENSISQCFFARYAEPDAEGADALAQPDWNSSRCPWCGESHMEVGYAFPLAALVVPTLQKAVADRARLLLLVPYSPAAAYCQWQRVTSATLAGDGRPLHVFHNLAAHLRHAGAYNPDSQALFALDFNLRPCANDFLHAAQCGQEFLARQRAGEFRAHRPAARQRASWESTLDKADRGLIHIALLDDTRSASSAGDPGGQKAPGGPAVHQ